MVYKLGLCGGPRGTHEAGIALFEDGKLILAIQEERLNRFKNAVSCWPTQSLTQLFKRIDISPQDIKKIAVPGETYADMGIRWPSYLKLNYGIVVESVKQVNHQLSHATAGFMNSDFEEALVITLDGVGDGLSGLVCKMSRSSIEPEIIQRFDNPLNSSIGFFWDAITQVIGFESLEEAYKTMGLAAYGKPKYNFTDFLDVVNGVPRLNSKFLTDQWAFSTFHPSERRYSDLFVSHYGFIPRKKQDSLNEIHADIAASAQLHLENCVWNLINYYVDKTSSKNIILSGGVALNSKMMGVLKDKLYPLNIFVPQLPSDGCLAFGSGATLLTKEEWKEFKYPSPYIGFEYTNEEIAKSIEMTGFPLIKYDEDYIVSSLLEDKVIGFFCGKSEFGPRALGARSIIASPIKAEMKDTVNKKIKFRESFRPFAPLILESNATKYFDIDKNANYEYMNFVVNATNIAKERAPAIVHQDGTSRVQVLKNGKNFKMESLLKKWELVSGCATLLNTSFNLRGEPIVETSSDAIRTFFSSGLDILVLEDYIISKVS